MRTIISFMIVGLLISSTLLFAGDSCLSCVENEVKSHCHDVQTKKCCSTQQVNTKGCHENLSSFSDCQTDETPTEVLISHSLKKDGLDLNIHPVIHVFSETVSFQPGYFSHDSNTSISSHTLNILKPIRLLC